MSLWSESSSSTQHGVDSVNYGHILSKTDDRACPLVLGQIRISSPAPPLRVQIWSLPAMTTAVTPNSRLRKQASTNQRWHHAGFTLDFLLVVVKSLQAFSLTREFHQIVLAASDPEVITMISFGRWNVFIITRPNISQKEQTSGEAWLSD